MNDIGELKERAEKLARQIGLVETELRTIDIFTKVDDISNEIKRLRDSNDLLHRENDELKVSLNTLISSVEDSRLSDLSETFLGVRNKMEAILESGRMGRTQTGAKTTSRLAVVADVVTAPMESPIGPSAEKEPERWNIPSGTQRTPGSTP
jgi:hypothetical protein